MRKLMNDVAAFHHKFGIDQPPQANQMPEDLARFRLMFLFEELREYAVALGYDCVFSVESAPSLAPDLEKQLDSLTDLVYVAVGTGLISGFDMGEAWDRVQEANMQKRRALPDGSDSARFSESDVVKPEGWTPPDLSDLVAAEHVAPVQLRWSQAPREAFGVLPGEWA